MEIMRLVVTGPVGSGKTTFIRTISEIEVVETDRIATDDVAQWKEKTTVALDFGKLQFAPEMTLHLYGTPGQARFDFMWQLLISKAHAYIVLVAAHRPKQFVLARRLIEFMDERAKIPMVIGVTHRDCHQAWEIENIAAALGYPEKEDRPLFISVNANETTSVAQAVITLVKQLMEKRKS